jgi:transposase
MIVPAQAIRVVVATAPVDAPKGHDGLAAIVERGLGLDPHSGLIVADRSKRGDRIKVLLWDDEEDQWAFQWKDRPTNGLVLISKRHEEGKFAWPAVRNGVMRLSRAQFEALKCGLDWRRVYGPTWPFRPTAAERDRPHTGAPHACPRSISCLA